MLNKCGRPCLNTGKTKIKWKAIGANLKNKKCYFCPFHQVQGFLWSVSNLTWNFSSFIVGWWVLWMKAGHRLRESALTLIRREEGFPKILSYSRNLCVCQDGFLGWMGNGFKCLMQHSCKMEWQRCCWHSWILCCYWLNSLRTMWTARTLLVALCSAAVLSTDGAVPLLSPPWPEQHLLFPWHSLPCDGKLCCVRILLCRPCSPPFLIWLCAPQSLLIYNKIHLWHIWWARSAELNLGEELHQLSL